MYQTYTARKPLSVCNPITLSLPGSYGMDPPAAHILQHTAHALQCTVNGDNSAVFFVFLSLVTLTFKLVQVRDQTRLPCKLGANPFSGSGDVWGTKNLAPCGTWVAFNYPRPCPWIGSYGIRSCITHRPVSTYQISLKSKKKTFFFWTD